GAARIRHARQLGEAISSQDGDRRWTLPRRELQACYQDRCVRDVTVPGVDSLRSGARSPGRARRTSTGRLDHGNTRDRNCHPAEGRGPEELVPIERRERRKDDPVRWLRCLEDRVPYLRYMVVWRQHGACCPHPAAMGINSILKLMR